MIPGSAPRKWRDENNFDGFFYYSNAALRYGIYADSWILEDRQPRILSRFANHIMGLRAEYYIDRNTFLVPYLGYQQSEDKRRTDWGWDLGISGATKDFPLGDYRTDLGFESNFDLYADRRNALNQVDLHFGTEFSPRASDSLALSYLSNRQQFFSTSSDDLLEVDIESEQLFNRLDYQLTNRSALRFDTRVLSKRIFDSQPQDVNRRSILRFENDIHYRLITSDLVLQFGLKSNQETTDNSGTRTDSEAAEFNFSSWLIYNIGQNDQLEASLDYVKFEYNTPDTISNNDDRDELRFIGELTYRHFFSPLLNAAITAYANFFHTIYIFREQSANNNWNRVFRLEGEVDYAHGGWRNRLQTQVLANFTVYDFDSNFINTRSFIFRKYSVSDSVTVPLTTNHALGLFTRLELEDRGNFFDSDFTQKLIQSSESSFFDLFLRAMDLFSFQVEMGSVLYQRKDWRHVPAKKQDREILRISPYFRISYPLSENLKFSTYVAHSYLRESKGGGLSDSSSDGSVEQREVEYTIGNLELIYNF